jgi:hypothetical protein
VCVCVCDLGNCQFVAHVIVCFNVDPCDGVVGWFSSAVPGVRRRRRLVSLALGVVFTCVSFFFFGAH